MDRRKEVLKAIIKHFVKTAEPVGSNTILVSYQFNVSPATIRNDMMVLEKEELIFQPHTSAGRVPTTKGYRLYVDEIADFEGARKEALKELNQKIQSYKQEQVRETLFDGVKLLAHATNNVSFATLPDNSRTFYLGLSNVLKQPEFASNTIHASQVVEVLENNDNFINILKSLEIDEKVQVFIGAENAIEQIQSCSIIVTQYTIDNFTGFFGVLGPTRMNYPYNMVVVEEIKKLIEKPNRLI